MCLYNHMIFPPSLTDRALQFQKQVEEAGVADGHVWLCVSQSNQLHYQIIHNYACSRAHIQVRRNYSSGVTSRDTAGQCAYVLKNMISGPPSGQSEMAVVDRCISFNCFQSGLYPILYKCLHQDFQLMVLPAALRAGPTS